MHLLFITGNYPSTAWPTSGTFVRNFVWAMARAGCRCTVINPVSVGKKRKGELPEYRLVEDAGGGAEVEVIHPRYVSFSSRRLGPFHTGRWTHAAFRRCVVRTVARECMEPDAVYGHFLYYAGQTAVEVGERLRVPSVVGVGEGEFWTVRAHGAKRARRELDGAAGFMAVSSELQRMLVEELGLDSAKIRVFPNGVDSSLFYPRDRAESCKNFGIPEETFNVAFVGGFHAGKGFPQLVEALRGLEDVRLIALGRETPPEGVPNVAYIGSALHHEVPEIISAADVFVLPTRVEGSCNAVVEALACGLPVVTSQGPHMDDLADANTAIRVDHNSPAEIRAAILAIKADPERRAQMRQACLERAKELDVNERARRVIVWMRELVGKPSSLSQTRSRGK